MNVQWIFSKKYSERQNKFDFHYNYCGEEYETVKKSHLPENQKGEIFSVNYISAITSTSTRTSFGSSLTATQLLAGFDVKYSP